MDEMFREFTIPARVVFGRGAALEAGKNAGAFGKRVLVITDAHVAANRACTQVIGALNAAGLDVRVYDGVNSEPDTRHVEEGVDLLRRHECDVIMALGGGSPIDAAKAISIMATNSGSMKAYMGHNKVPRPGLPLIAVPTTAGTGSEVTRFTIITEPGHNVKMLIGSPYLFSPYE